MPWKVRTHVEVRKALVVRYLRGEWTMTALCQEYGVSRKTGDKWLKRFTRHGEEGLAHRSRRPKKVPHQTADAVLAAVIAKKRQYPKWGPKKLRRLLCTEGVRAVPSESTIGRLLQRYGLVHPQRRRKKSPRHPTPLTTPLYPNHVWAVDFKGWFRTRDGKRCEPLTISDAYSRYVLACAGLTRITTKDVHAVFEQVFRRYGQPLIIRSDNGAPFASRAVVGLSSLSVWWLQLGIEPELIAPGHPEQNGGHERMHKTLKVELLDTVGRNGQDQQQRFDAWRRTFNTIRPHEAIGMHCPAEWYTPSPRRYRKRLTPYTYPARYKIRRIKRNGEMRWQGRKVYVSETLGKQQVGLKPVTPTAYELYFRTKKLGMITTDDTKVLPVS